MLALFGRLGLGIQTTQGAGGGLLGEPRVKVLCTFSMVKVPFPGPFSIMMSSVLSKPFYPHDNFSLELLNPREVT